MWFLDGSSFKIKIADIFNFKWIKYLGKGLSYLKNRGIGVNYCWSYGPSKFLLHFIEAYKNRSKLDKSIFWTPQPKEISGKSFKFFGPPTAIWRHCKSFAKLNGNHVLMASQMSDICIIENAWYEQNLICQ